MFEHEPGDAGDESARFRDVAPRLGEELGGLTCTECQCRSGGRAQGWQAHRADLDEIAIYCPECAEREFAE